MTLVSPMNFVKENGTEKGRGVFAGQDYEEGSIVEESPAIILSSSYTDLPEDIQRLVFEWDKLAGEEGSTQALALGYGSLYNSANPANMRYEADKAKKIIRFIAARKICAGEELTINYSALGGTSESHDNNWFDRQNIPFVP